MTRGYSTKHTPRSKQPAVKARGQAGYGRYLLDRIPAGLWSDVRAKANKDGTSLRALILSLLETWLKPTTWRVGGTSVVQCPRCAALVQQLPDGSLIRHIDGTRDVVVQKGRPITLPWCDGRHGVTEEGT